jgi:pilus assembly protein Flp/PilA
MLQKIRNFLGCKKGQGMTEYIIIVALLAIACITVYQLFGDSIQSKTTEISGSLDAVQGTPE